MNARLLIYPSLLAISVGTSCASTPLIVAADGGTLAVAEHTIRCWPGPHVEFLYGYRNSRPLGSYLPTGVGGGKTLVELYDQTSGGCKLVTGSTLSVSGFSLDPGRRWLSSILCNGVELSESAASQFYFSGDTATWEWTQQFGLQWRVGTTVRCTVSHAQ